MAGKNATSEDKIPQVEPSNANAFQRSTLSALKGDGKTSICGVRQVPTAEG